MRKQLYALCLTAIFALMLHTVAQATHNRAGEISIQIAGDCVESNTIKATVVTYTKTSSVDADRDTVTICWGDGTCDRVARMNGPGSPPKGEPLENDTKKNIYMAFHTYSARSTYTIYMTDPNRNAGVLNVNPPNSVQIKFHLQTTYTFPSPQNQGCNSTPVLLQPPIDFGCVGKVFTHNPNAFDADDGDSLAYELVVPLQDLNTPVPNYLWPDQLTPLNNDISINPVTGDITWNSPRQPGEYNIAMHIISYRNGFVMDIVLRDMQILIRECDNQPPDVTTTFDEICVIAGEVVEIQVTAGAPLFETDQKVKLTAQGGPFFVPFSPATFEPASAAYQEDPVVKTFRWQTVCEHIGSQYYTVVFKATDDFFDGESGLATLKTVRIKVVGPPPEDVRSIPGSGQVELTWLKPYSCDAAEENYFKGFTVWRREGSNNFPLDDCTPGLEGQGYVQVTPQPIKTEQADRYYYKDLNVERGRTYCYRVLAIFAKTTPGGDFFYNRVESLPSEETCVQLSRDVPLITHVNVLQTGATNGEMEVCWSKPKPVDLDTIVNPGPYRYEVLRANGQTTAAADFQPIGVNFFSDFFATANDTCFTDAGLNTAGQAYSYKINFYVNGEATPLGATNPASSVFLSSAPTDNRLNLSWTEVVPWDNFKYVVFKRNASGVFDSLTTVLEQAYSDVGLINGQEYCYRVKSIGSYGVEGVISPLLNFSQELCSVPVDNVAPCPPTLEVSNICNQDIRCTDETALFNSLRWVNPMQLCVETDDVTGYRVYYAPFESSGFVRVAEFDDSGKLTWEHKPEFGIAGCYAVTAVDTFFNESTFSNVVCVDNCPSYVLPNTFTPNGDGQNDAFKPYPYCFIESIELNVFNRWGQLVFQTNDPDINWDGRNIRGEMLTDGVYYYTCRVFERRVAGIVQNPQILSGYIELLRGGN